MGDFGSGRYSGIYGNKQLQGNEQAFQEDMMDEQMANMQNMFPFTNLVSDFAMTVRLTPSMQTGPRTMIC